MKDLAYQLYLEYQNEIKILREQKSTYRKVKDLESVAITESQIQGIQWCSKQLVKKFQLSFDESTKSE